MCTCESSFSEFDLCDIELFYMAKDHNVMKDMDSFEEAEFVHPTILQHSMLEVVDKLTIHNCLGQK